MLRFHSANLGCKMWTEISTKITQVTGKVFEIVERKSLSGGCINQVYLISNNTDRYLLKLNQPSLIEMFVAEAAGLSEISLTDAIIVK